MTMGLLAFHGLTVLDLIGPYEVLMRAPGATVLIVSAHPGELTVRGVRVRVCLREQQRRRQRHTGEGFPAVVPCPIFS